MHVSAVKSLLSALHMLSHQSMTETSGSVSSASSKQIGSISFSVDRMISILVNNLHSMFSIDFLSSSSEYNLSFPCCRLVCFLSVWICFCEITVFLCATGVEPLWDQVVGHFLEVTRYSLLYLFVGYPDIVLGFTDTSTAYCSSLNIQIRT